MPELIRYTTQNVTLLTDPACSDNVRFAFTERTGGVSCGVYSSLNIGRSSGDDTRNVQLNRNLVLGALGAKEFCEALISPAQVHGDDLVEITSCEPKHIDAMRKRAAAGADGVLCCACNVPVLLGFADCAPVVIIGPEGFAVVHSGWRGTYAGIAGKAAKQLAEMLVCKPGELTVYIGPHIGAEDYEVSDELFLRFYRKFGKTAVYGTKCVDLAGAIKVSLYEAGCDDTRICVYPDSTASHTDRFFSHRAEAGHTGRHGACAIMCDNTWELFGSVQYQKTSSKETNVR